MHRELVDQAKRGDEEAFDALARLVGDRCMAIACRILRDSHLAEDAVQSALVTAWRELRTLRDPDRFEPWLHRILTNECYAEARRRTQWSANIRLLPVDGPVEATGYLTVNDRDQLERAFRRLTLEARAVLVFHHYLGLHVARGGGSSRHPPRDREVPPPSRDGRAQSERRSRRANPIDHPGATRMTAPRDTDRLVSAFLEEGQTELPVRAYDGSASRHPPDTSTGRDRPVEGPCHDQHRPHGDRRVCRRGSRARLGQSTVHRTASAPCRLRRPPQRPPPFPRPPRRRCPARARPCSSPGATGSWTRSCRWRSPSRRAGPQATGS